MQKLIVLSLLTLAIIIQTSQAAEIDSVTPRKLQLTNSLSSINEIFNKRLQEGLLNANKKQDDFEDIDSKQFCDEKILYRELRKAIFQSFTASLGLKGYDLDKQLRELLADQSYSLSLDDSIYSDINYFEGFSINFKELSDVVNINGHLVGIDKIGHFFAEGWQYFEQTRYDDESIGHVLKWGQEMEEGVFGYTTTGIFSFADLVANFNGWRFWNKILLREKDPLKGIIDNFLDKPYLKCKTQFIASITHRKWVRAWEINSQFDISNYADGTWDEGNNCNNYKAPAIEEKVAARIKEVSADFACPLLPEYCVESQDKYGAYAKHVLHPRCLTATRKFSPN